MSAPGDALGEREIDFLPPPPLSVSIHSPKLHFGAATLSLCPR